MGVRAQTRSCQHGWCAAAPYTPPPVTPHPIPHLPECAGGGDDGAQGAPGAQRCWRRGLGSAQRIGRGSRWGWCGGRVVSGAQAYVGNAIAAVVGRPAAALLSSPPAPQPCLTGASLEPSTLLPNPGLSYPATHPTQPYPTPNPNPQALLWSLSMCTSGSCSWVARS